MNKGAKLLDKKIKKISSNAIREYLNFWGYSYIDFEINNQVSLDLKEKYLEINRLDEKTGKGLIVVEKYKNGTFNESYITLNQLCYDLEVFATIPAELKQVLNITGFRKFLKKSFFFMKDQGWQIIISNESRIISIINYEKHYSVLNDQEIINDKVLLIFCDDNDNVADFYNKYKSKVRIEKHRFLELFREYVIEEICRYFKIVLESKGVSLFLINWNWAQNNCLFPKTKVTSCDKEKQSEYSVYNIVGNEEKYSTYLKQIYEDDYSLEYVRNVMDIPLRNDYALGYIHHSDMESKYLNVFCGERLTTNQPANYQNSIFMLGGCVFFGYAIDDSHTISSFLQKKLNDTALDREFRVCNFATWGGNIDQTYGTFYELNYKRGDIVVVSYAGIVPLGDDIERTDISLLFKEINQNSPFYFDCLVHCNKKGYALAAERLFEIIKETININPSDNEEFRLTTQSDLDYKNGWYYNEIVAWVDSITELLPPIKEKGKVYGAIVMNCNPFTFGHQYLIETAASQVDCLFVFVVEEDKSFFPFKDRFDLVKKGTEDIKNVFVIPSGKFMISAVTFPGYFSKENPDKSSIDSSVDVELFGRYIAPVLGITKRFVGEEPSDIVTAKYNQTMAAILPRFGIELTIIKRKVIKESGYIISASKVRLLIKEKKYDEIKKYVPISTYKYIIGKFI